jgi:hypothetical protein
LAAGLPSLYHLLLLAGTLEKAYPTRLFSFKQRLAAWIGV